MANKNTSPGVYTSERELNFNTETVGVTTLGLVGETLKGPAFQPIFIRDFDSHVSVFGGTSAEKFKGTQIPKYELPYIAKSYLTQSNQLYVTRVLGLSGYDAGDTIAIRTLGSVDPDSVVISGETNTGIFENSSTIIYYDVTGNSFYEGETNMKLVDYIFEYYNPNNSFTKADIETSLNTFFRVTGTTTGATGQPWRTGKFFYWGYMDQNQKTYIQNYVTDEFPLTGSTFASNSYDGYVTPNGLDRNGSILKNKSTYTDNHEGYQYRGDTFGLLIPNPNSPISEDPFVYVAYFYKSTFLANPNPIAHKKTVALLRSKGDINLNQTVFRAHMSTVNFSTGNTASAYNPFADFVITGTPTQTGLTNFSYTLSLDPNKKSYVKSVLGETNSDKDGYLYCAEAYPKWLKKQYEFGNVEGLIQTVSRKTDWNHFKFQYQTPSSPYVVSEIRGNNVSNLFKFLTISDGNHANTEVKVSFANLDFNNRTFDVLVRDFNDTDANPVIYERFVNCVMDKTSADYVGRKIGTADGEFSIVSKFIYVDIADNAPSDALPCGFRGYIINSLTSNAEGIDSMYRTKYYNPNEVINYNQLVGSTILSNGDKVRKTYLGITDGFYGFDADLFKFKGKDNNGNAIWGEGSDFLTTTKGFHLDSGATGITDNDIQVFECGEDILANVSQPNNAYYDIKTRKFTLCVAGGFDGWDIFRNTRTNTDTYKIGRTGFIQAEFDTFVSSEFNDTFGNSDYYAYLTGIKSFENPEQISLNVFATPGIDIINNTDLVRDAIEMIEENRLDSVYFPTLPDINLYNNTNPSNTDDWLYPTDIVNALDDSEIDSSYVALFYPWIQISDVNNNANIFIPPTSEVVKNIAFTDNVSQPWFASAGYTRGKVNAKKTRFVLKQNDRDDLYDGRINPIATFSDVGIVIWGNRTTYSVNTPRRDLNVRRLLLQARKLVVAVSNRLLFDPKDDTIKSQFTSQVTPILDNIRKERGLTDFRIKLSDSADRNTLIGKIFIKPTPTLETVELEFVVTPDSVSFNEL
jgi:hypothetical protein